MHKVFVFGTLKEGFPNFKTNKGIRYGNTFQTKQRFPLYLIGERHSPWLVLQQGEGYPVKGQVFSVTDQALSAMDKLERIEAKDGYRRISLEVECVETGEALTVYAYGKPPEMLVDADIRAQLTDEYCLSHANLYRSRYATS
ncbi:gamma-glutamylcyclotransferase family protein [Vibrio tubiashii]|uniref:gamma-glutamylcyclotransferase family protein n=1 Tax=Vibrio tubiashii TaxID=29498 RepID=UPI00349E502D